MTSFSGVVRLAHDPGATILADLDVFDDRLVLSAAGSEIGSWPRNTLDLRSTGAGFAFEADGEEIIIEPSDLYGFSEAMGLEPSSNGAPPARQPLEDIHVTRLEPGTLLDAEPTEDVDPTWVREQTSTFGSLRERSAAEWHESDTIDRPVLYIIGIAVALTILGVILGWGNGNLVIADFAVERALFGLVGVVLIAAIFMAVTERQERQVIGLTTIGTGIFALLVLWLWGRSTGVAMGYLVGAVAATVAIVGGILAAADWAWVVFPHHEMPEDQTEKKRRGRFSRLLRRR